MDEEPSVQDFIVTGTSPYTAMINDVAIRQGENTRLVLRSQLVTNQKDTEASVIMCLMHQKRHSRKDPWQDADSFNLATLKAGQEVRLSLSAGETRKLYDALTMQYELPIGGWSRAQEQRLTVVDMDTSRIVTGREKQIIEELLEQEGEQFWDYIEDLRPGLLEVTCPRCLVHRL